MKKLLGILLTAIMMLSLAACGDAGSGNDTAGTQSGQEEAVSVPETAGDILNALKEKNNNVTDIIEWDENTDPNGKLGRPGEYTGKADFSDARVEESWTTEEEKMQSGLNGGTVEVFGSKSDCNDRYEYLKQFTGADMGVFGLNQYMYKYDLVIFRVSYDVAPTDADEYKAQMDEILNEEGEAAEV